MGLFAPCRAPYAGTLVCGPSTWLSHTACQISASYLYASCSFANMYLLTIILCTQKWGFEGFSGWRCENVVF